MKLTAEHFRKELQGQLAQAEKQGKRHIDINSGMLHRELGNYPGKHHSMPNCCQVMRAEMNDKDKIINEPPSGMGASLTIQYKLPR